MKTNCKFWIVVFLALLAVSPAYGQSAQPEPSLLPGAVQVIDGAGVNLRSGQMPSAGTALTIGDASDPALEYRGQRFSIAASGKTPFGSVESFCDASYPNSYCSSYQLKFNLSGQILEWFNYLGTSEIDNGAIVLSNNKMRTRDGTIWEFTTYPFQTDVYSPDPTKKYKAWLSKVTYPDGVVITLSQPQDMQVTPSFVVTSSLGYRQMASSPYGGGNWYVQMQNLTCDGCSFPIRRGQYGINLSNHTYSTPFTDRMGSEPVAIVTQTRNTTAQTDLFTVSSPEGRSIQLQRSYDPREFNTDPNLTVVCRGRSLVNYVDTPAGRWSYSYTLSSSTCQPYSTVSTAPDGSTMTVTGLPGKFSVTDGNGNTTQYSVSLTTQFIRDDETRASDGAQLYGVTYPEGNKVEYSYTRSNVTQILYTSKDGQQTRKITAVYPNSCTDATAKVCNKPTSVTDSLNGTTNYEYHTPSGFVSKVTSPAGANGIPPETRYSYQQFTVQYYDSPGNLVTSPPIWRLVRTSTCMTLAPASCIGTADEIITTYGYNQNLLVNRIEVQRGDGSEDRVTSKTYDLVGNLIAVDGPAAGTADTVYYRYDDHRQKVGEISPDPDGSGSLPYHATRITYDFDGNPTKIEKGTLSTWQSESVAPANWDSAFTLNSYILNSYDALGRKTFERVNGSDNVTVSVTQYNYDSAGRLQCTAVRMNPAVYGSLPASACTLGTQGSDGPDRITKNVYDAAGQLIQVRKAVGTSLEQAYATYSYTANGKQQYVIDANGNRAQMVYDGFDRLKDWYFPSATPPSAYNDGTQASALASAGGINSADYEEYGYDANGNRTSLRKRDGSTLSYTYDALNRMTVKVVPERANLSPTYTRDVYYGYDLQGHQLYARFDSPTGEGVTYSWNGFGEKTGETLTMDGVSRTLTSQYDADGNRTLLTYPDGNAINYQRDGLGRLYAASLNAAKYLIYPTYQADGNLSMLYRRATSSDSWSDTAVTGFAYDPAGRLSTMTHSLPSGANYTTISFTRNAASQITSRTQSNDAYAWTGAVNVERGYTANGLNQYSDVGGTSFAYDANGNLTSDGTNSYTYDVENRLVYRSGDGTTATMRYDPLGRLYEVVGTTSGSTTSATRFLYDGDALVAEYNFNASDPPLRRYVHGDSAGDDPLVWFEGGTVTDSARRYLYADERGSIIAVTDGDGNKLAIDSYDEYGIPDDASAASLTTKGRFRYTGQTLIPELGMYYYKARMYSPTLGRFMQTDPIGYKDQINLYAYVANDPVNEEDPSGLSPRWREVMRDLEKDGSLPPGSVEKAESTHTSTVFGILSSMVPVEGVLAKGGALLKAAFGMEKVAGPGFGAARAMLRETFAAGRQTMGRAEQFVGTGGEKGAAQLFGWLTKGAEVTDRGGTRVATMSDGSVANMRSTMINDTTRRTTVEVQRFNESGRVVENLKTRFDEIIK